MKQTGVRRLALAGGVAANEGLRSAALALKADGVEVFVPPKARCTDNGSMIASAGRMHLLAGRTTSLDTGVKPAWQVGT
jgi:N6-L-threonylcarbamoyladenine synthase